MDATPEIKPGLITCCQLLCHDDEADAKLHHQRMPSLISNLQQSLLLDDLPMMMMMLMRSSTNHTSATPEIKAGTVMY